MSGLVKVSSYHGTTLEFSELRRATHKYSEKQSACLGVCFYTSVVMKVIGAPYFKDLDDCLNTFGILVYVSVVLVKWEVSHTVGVRDNLCTDCMKHI